MKRLIFICCYADINPRQRLMPRAGRRAYLDRFNWEQQTGLFTYFINGPDHA